MRGKTMSRVGRELARRASGQHIVARCVVLPVDETDEEDGIPVTTPARTLFDLAAVVTSAQLEHAVNEAEYRRLTSPVSLVALLAGTRDAKGTPPSDASFTTTRRTARPAREATSSATSSPS